MANEGETVEAAIAAVRKMIHGCPAINGGLGEFWYQLKANGAIDRIEAAHKREMKHQAVHNCELRAKSGLCGLKDEIRAHNREVAELRRRLKVAEDALVKIRAEANQHELDADDTGTVFDTADNVLAAIREEGARSEH